MSADPLIGPYGAQDFLSSRIISLTVRRVQDQDIREVSGMSSKVTLYMDESVVRHAKEYAQSRHKSLSQLIEQYLRFLTESEGVSSEITPRVSRLSDTLELPASEDQLKFDYLSRKYLDADSPHRR